MKKRLKINGIIVFFAVLLIVIFPRLFFRREEVFYLDEVTEICGVALILLGQILRASARGYKSEYSLQGQALIQDGPYALVRNPMYLGILLVGSGIILMLFNWWVVAIFLLFFIIRYLLLVLEEEKKLAKLFPIVYQEYCKKVPRIIPSIGTLLNTQIHQYLPLKFKWLKREIGSILAVLLITLFLESWEDISSEGLRVYFSEAVMIAITVGLFMLLVFYLIHRTGHPLGDVSDKSKNNL